MNYEQDYCKLCGAKLEDKSGDTLYYCMKCNEQTNKEKTLRRGYKWQKKPKEQQKEL